MIQAPSKCITTSQVTGVLRQAQTYQSQCRFDDAINLCEQILESGFDRPDARYLLGWIHQEQQHWDDAIRQFQMLLNDPDYAPSCYYALGQCYRARGDLRMATVHFDEAVDRVNLDALTVEESDQLVQLCQEAAEAHRLLGEQEQAMTVYGALLGFLRSRGWSEKVAQVEYMLQQSQNGPASQNRQVTPPPGIPLAMSQDGMRLRSTPIPEMPTTMLQAQPADAVPPMNSEEASKMSTYLAQMTELEAPQAASIAQASQAPAYPIQSVQPAAPNMAAPAQPVRPVQPSPSVAQAEQSQINGVREDIQPVAPVVQALVNPAAQPIQTVQQVPSQALPPVAQVQMAPAPASMPVSPVQPIKPVASPPPVVSGQPIPVPVVSTPQDKKLGTEDVLKQLAGRNDQTIPPGAEALLESTISLPEDIRGQVVRSMQDIQYYIHHGLFSSASEECLRVIEMAPQYLDVHQALCEIYVHQDKVELAITKYMILVDTYIANGRVEDAIATYRRVLQLEPNNLICRLRLIHLFASHGYTEDLFRERTLAAESYLRLGYLDRALMEFEQILQEKPTSVPIRLNYALALQKQGRILQAVAEYQHVLQLDPCNVIALVRWHIAMITSIGAARSTSLEVLTRIRWQLRGEGQRNAEAVIREYSRAVEIYPHNADVHFALGQMYYQAGLFDQALDAYRVAMRDGAVEVLARMSAAQCLQVQGKPEAAIEHFEQTLQMVRRSPTSLNPATWSARPREEGEEHRTPEMEISLQLAKVSMSMSRRELTCSACPCP